MKRFTMAEPEALSSDHEFHRARPTLTKILATLGPSTDNADTLRKIVESGASLFRLNFSHGTDQEHLGRLELVRAIEKETGIPLAVLGDLPGPKIRIGNVTGAPILLETGQDVRLRAGFAECIDGATPIIGCNYEPLAREVKPGQRVLINDGAIRMLAVEIEGGDVLCRVTHGGPVTSRKGLNLPETDLSVPALTDKDIERVRWAVEHGIDYIALSFVRRAEEVLDLQHRLERLCLDGVCGTGLDEDRSPRIPIIAKIETPQALSNIDSILEVADGLMVARGDLGVEMDVARVPMIQKVLIRKAHDYGKPCIVATQMLETMIEHATPTRAEVSDVANAIVDGADAVMLSGETAVGKYPVLTVETMRRVAAATEESLQHEPATASPPKRLQAARQITTALAHGAWHMARDVGAKVFVVWSEDGGAARLLSRNNFRIPIVAFSSDRHAVRRMCLLSGVLPILEHKVPEHRSEFAAMAERRVLDMGLVEIGERGVFMAGKPLDTPHATNTISIRILGDLTKKQP